MKRRFLTSRDLAVLLGLLLAGRGADGRQEPDSPDARFIKSARALLASGKPAAEARLREAKEAVIAAAREENDRDERLGRALKESTTRLPLRLSLDRSATIDNVRVTAYAGGVVSLAWPQGEVQYPLAMLSEDARAALVGIALSKGTARDAFEMGKLLLRGKDYDGAGRCFASAVRLDPSLGPAVPDVDRLKRAARLFEGSFRLAGSALSLRWGFSSAAEAGDFQALQGNFGVKPGAGLEFFAPKLALTAVKEIPFRNRVRLSILPRETDSAAHLMGIRFVKPDGGVVLVYGALATAQKLFMVVRVEDGRTQELLAPTPGASGNRMTMEFNRGRMTFQVGDKTVWSGTEGGFADVLAVLGSTALPKGTGSTGASAMVKEVSLQGDVNPVWMTKKTAALRDALASELLKEDRARKGDAGSGPRLSIDAALAEQPPVILDFYRSALAKVAAARKSQLQEDLNTAQAAMEELTRVDSAFAAPWYYRGEMEEWSGSRRAAGESYERALALLPEFPEALCGRGRLQALAGSWPAAKESAERALALKPDLADAHLLRGRVLWESRDAAAVLEATQTARALAPADPGILASAQQLSNVARGPRWARTSVHESAHYSVRSDLPAARCREYAEHLEALRTHYEEVLGRPLPAGRKADVLIFESEEGYYAYSDLTVGSRQEQTLGAFSPWYGQMALFEGVDVQETCRVLSHEGFHQALHTVAGDVPIWLNEGLAEYVGAARVARGAVVERGGLQSGRLDHLTAAVKYGWQPVPFEHLLLESQAEFYALQAPLKYAQAWSMVRYFLDGEGGRWKPVMRDYIARVLAGDSAREAFEATFAKQDSRVMEAGWLKHYGLVVRSKSASAITSAPGDPTVGAPPLPPTDLMALLATTAPNPLSGWTLADGTLESSRFASAGLDLGHEPVAEYDWRLTLRRTGGEGPLLLGLQGGGATFLLRLDDRGVTRVDTADGPAAPAPGAARPRAVLPVGKAVSIVCSIRKSGVLVTADRELLVDWKGEFTRLSYTPGEDMPPATNNLFLFSKDVGFQITAMSVEPRSTGSPLRPAPSPNNAAPEIPADLARSIPVEGDLRRWVVDDEGRQILALDTAGTLQLISLGERKLTRKIAVGKGAAALFLSPGGFKSVWVGFLTGGSLVRVDLERGEIVETIPTGYPADGLAIFRKVAYCVVPGGGLGAVDLSEKKDLGYLGGSYFTTIVYEVRKDRLWGLSGGLLIEFDGSKTGPALREMNRKSLSAPERAQLTGTINALGKRHAVGGQDPVGMGPQMLLDERSGRMYVSAVAVKTDKPEATVGVFRSPAHSLASDPAVREFTGRILGRDQILAASADGKWVASGSHLFNAATFAVLRELPLPTTLVAFVRDSKELAYYDWVNHAIVTMEVEPK